VLILLLGLWGTFRARNSRHVRGISAAAAALLPVTLLAGIPGTFLEPVEVAQWGGLLLTIIFGIYGAILALPVGVALALARRSKLPLIAGVTTLWIEAVRAVPLITILFVANYLFPLFLPQSWPTPPLFMRALIAVALFGGVYVAEVVRGGLQAIKPGQHEAGLALGLSLWQLQFLVILPQALRHVLPALVSTVIGMIKDTSLVSTIGMFDLLGVARSIPANPEWIGHDIEVLLAAAMLYWLICWSVAKVGRQLEETLRLRAH
jgi:general L-amino acid transport system permease protein